IYSQKLECQEDKTRARAEERNEEKKETLYWGRHLILDGETSVCVWVWVCVCVCLCVCVCVFVKEEERERDPYMLYLAELPWVFKSAFQANLFFSLPQCIQ